MGGGCAGCAAAQCVRASYHLQVLPDVFDFGFQGFVFGHLAPEEAFGQPGAAVDTGGGEHVQVAFFVGALAEVPGLDQAFVHQRLQAVVDLAQTDAQLVGQLPLADIGVLLQGAQEVLQLASEG